MSELREHVEESIRARNLLRRGQRILVAVSGGLDSMVLLNLLAELSRDCEWRLTVAHLNHQLRGRSSDADERLVVRTARNLGIEAVTGRVNVKEVARADGLSTEMAARKLRHEFLARRAARLRIRTIALAHHADDQVELFFLRLFRGSGSEGWGGMKWRSPSPADSAIELIRPLLAQRKSVLAEYARVRGIAFRKDASNASLDFRRNRIRHELLPLLRRHYQPALDRIISRTMEISQAEADFITSVAREWLDGSNGRKFQELPLTIQRRSIQLQLTQRGIAPDYELIERLRLAPNTAVCVAQDRALTLDLAGRLHEAALGRVEPSDGRLEIELSGGAGEFKFENMLFRWRIEKRGRANVLKRPRASECFDADKVGSRILLRHWQPGDRFQPIGMSLAVKLQDLFTNEKIPRGERHRLILAANASGELFWVEKLRISERFKLSSETNHRLRWQWKRL